ncbi:MAG: oligopeptide transporter protein [Myxococcaceae bacterium]|nr:oligopeptide transporter protein [Myxococcaceae bacterium]
MTSPPSPSQGRAATPGSAPHEPYIPPEAELPELSVRALLLGTLLGMVFGASSLYLVLKVGLTVSASIPVAVISITLFRLAHKLGVRDASILENNIVQTAGSAGESIAFGVGVTMPAIMILGFSLELTRVMLVATLGGLLGILLMIPLRRALIVAQHDQLKYPEGTACAEVLKAGASEESRAAHRRGHPAGELALQQTAGDEGAGARTIFTGFSLGLLYKAAMSAGRLWKDAPEKVFGAPLEAGSVSAEISPELLGVGYIIGPRIASIMCAGGVLAYLVLIPLIKFFGDGLPGPLAPGTIPISEMGPGQIRQAYVLYIGAGAVTAGGLVSLVRSLPTIWHGIEGAAGARVRGLFRRGALGAGSADRLGAGTDHASALRTERDLPPRFVAVGIVLLLTAITLSPKLHMNLLGALIIAAFGFLFVAVSSRLTGEIGSSSNPISGMTVATLLFTCLIFLALGWTGPSYYVTALSVGAIVCIAASNGGTTSQDLKTGYLIGATPRLQQLAILVGALASALLLGPILLKLNETATVYVPVEQLTRSALYAPPAVAQSELTHLQGPQAASDQRAYRLWHKADSELAPSGHYLVDPGTRRAVWLVDPGINGAFDTRPDGSKVKKFDAPKATLMSYIIQGILDRKLPWGLVLFGGLIALVLELSHIPSLAFAVGLYLPISSSTPILVGGLVRFLVDARARKHAASELARASHEQTRAKAEPLDELTLAAESDRSPGVLMASGYIAGGAIAGIVIAFIAGLFDRLDNALAAWASAHNPFYAGPHADLLALLPFAGITFLLYRAGQKT